MKIKLGQTVKVVECGCNHKGVHNGLMGKVVNFWDNGDVDVSLPKDICFARKVTSSEPKPMKRIKKEVEKKRTNGDVLLDHIKRGCSVCYEIHSSPKPSKIDEAKKELVSRISGTKTLDEIHEIVNDIRREMEGSVDRGWEERFEKLCVPFYKTKHKDEIKSFIRSLLKEERRELESKILRMTSDIAHAIGYCRGLGHPETYLEKQYPELSKLKDSFTDCRK